jgi:hypothetical protein
MVLYHGMRSFSDSREEFDISGLAPGIYLLTVTGESGQMAGKIIKY